MNLLKVLSLGPLGTLLLEDNYVQKTAILVQVGFPNGNDRYDHDDYIADNDDDDDDGDDGDDDDDDGDDDDDDDDEDDDVPTIIGITAFR